MGNLKAGKGHQHGKFLNLFWGTGDDRWAPGHHRGQPALLRHRAPQERHSLVTASDAAGCVCHEVFAGLVALIKPHQMTPDSAG
jgi:hypothetical protein